MKGLILTPVCFLFRSIILRITDQIIRIVTTLFRWFGFEKRNFLTTLVIHIRRAVRNSTSNTRKRMYIAIDLLKAEHKTFISKEADCGKKINTRKSFFFFPSNYNKTINHASKIPAIALEGQRSASSGRLKAPGFVPLACKWGTRWELEKQSVALRTLAKNSNRTRADDDKVTGPRSHKIPSHSTLLSRIIFPVKLLQKRTLGTQYYYSSATFGEQRKGLK